MHQRPAWACNRAWARHRAHAFKGSLTAGIPVQVTLFALTAPISCTPLFYLCAAAGGNNADAGADVIISPYSLATKLVLSTLMTFSMLVTCSCSVVRTHGCLSLIYYCTDNVCTVLQRLTPDPMDILDVDAGYARGAVWTKNVSQIINCFTSLEKNYWCHFLFSELLDTCVSAQA